MIPMKPKLLFYDHGLFVFFAIRLSKWFEVFYYTPWDSQSFPAPNNAFIGDGVESITRVKDFWAVMPEMEYFFFADIYAGGLQEHLRSMGKRVFGAGRGDALEILRWKTRGLMAQVELPVNPAVRVIGIDALRKHLESNDDKYVKISGYRGLIETFHSKTYQQIAPLLDEIGYNLGGLKNILPFIVEDAIDAVVETGGDLYSIDGKYPSCGLFGIEVKDCGYVGMFKPTAEMPDEIMFVYDKLSPILAALQYRFLISTEIRIDQKGVPWLIDLTNRLPSPPSQIQSVLIENWDQIIIEGSQGICIDPIGAAKYGVSATICASAAESAWVPIAVDPKIADRVMFHNLCEIEGVQYIIPQPGINMCEIGAAVGLGNTLKEAADNCREAAAGVQGYTVKTKLDSLSDALCEIENMQSHGIKFTDDELPTEL